MDEPANPCEEPCNGPECGDYTLGCTDPNATNYNPDATIDDGTCEFVGTFCDENPNDPLCIDCDTSLDGAAPRAKVVTGNLDDTICDPVNGSEGYCTDPMACNYNPDAPLDLSNNQICDYCSCSGVDDPDCTDDTDCDPATDPNCQPPEPECPDPSNPNCNPDVFDPCPGDECGPPIDPCLILGNCGDPEPPGGGPDDVFDWEEPVLELTCIPQINGQDAENFDNIIQASFRCTSNEGQKMLFRMKSGAKYDDTDLLKISLISYLFNGGSDNSQLPCLFNCNYDSAEKNREFNAQEEWARKGARFYNSTDVFNKGDMVMYYYQVNGVTYRNIYIARQSITPLDPHPRYSNSGWERAYTVRTRTKDTNGIATGNENYLTVFWEYMTRFCNGCVVQTQQPSQEENNVDPKILKNYLDPKQNPTPNNKTQSGILGEDGEEIIF
jgi:hypothetical protein